MSFVEKIINYNKDYTIIDCNEDLSIFNDKQKVYYLNGVLNKHNAKSLLEVIGVLEINKVNNKIIVNILDKFNNIWKTNIKINDYFKEGIKVFNSIDNLIYYTKVRYEYTFSNQNYYYLILKDKNNLEIERVKINKVLHYNNILSEEFYRTVWIDYKNKNLKLLKAVLFNFASIKNHDGSYRVFYPTMDLAIEALDFIKEKSMFNYLSTIKKEWENTIRITTKLPPKQECFVIYYSLIKQEGLIDTNYSNLYLKKLKYKEVAESKPCICFIMENDAQDYLNEMLDRNIQVPRLTIDSYSYNVLYNDSNITYIRPKVGV